MSDNRISEKDALKALDIYLETGMMSEVARLMGLSGYHRAKDRVVKGAKIRGVVNPISVGDKEFTGSSRKEKALAKKLSGSLGNLEEEETGEGARTLSLVTDRVITLEDLLSRAGLDSKEWDVASWSANKWETFSKTEGIVELWQIKASLVKIPPWILNPAKASPVIKRSKSRGLPSSISTVLVIPDSQNGYIFDPKSQVYEPLHDRDAWDVAIQIAEEMQPEKIVMLGDMLDLAPFSRFPTDPSLRNTTQPSILELHWWISELRRVCPAAEIKFLEGNHESRIYRAIVDHYSGEFVTLTPADDPDGPSLLSIERLIGLDSLDVGYVAPYGKAWWLWDKVMFHHGNTVRSGSGATVTAVLREATQHQVFGHIHRTELASKRLHGPNQTSRVIYAMSPGSLCRVDGVVPAAVPRLNWQQGLGVVQLDTLTDTVHMNVIHIDGGVALWSGNRFEGRDRRREIASATQWPF